jgi:tetratricopeptide (TPR) repeat protein
MKRLPVSLLLISFLSVSLMATYEITILSREYLLESQYTGNRTDDSRAILAIAVGLKYRETIQPNYKTWFNNLYKELESAPLSQEISQSLEIVHLLVSVSTVSAINELRAKADLNDLLRAISLRIHFYDWENTRDPRSATEIKLLALDLLEGYSESYFPYKALLELYSSAGTADRESLMAVRAKIFEAGLEDLLGFDLFRSLFVSGMMELVKEDFQRLRLDDALSKYYVATAYLRTGERDLARPILETVDLRELPPRFASDASTVMGDMLFDERKLDEAIEHYQEAIRYWPDNSRAVRNLGMTYYETRERDNYDLARFYLQMSGYEGRDSDVETALKELRRRAIFELALVTVLPLGVVVVGGLFLLEYISRKRKNAQIKRLLEKNGGIDEDRGS